MAKRCKIGLSVYRGWIGIRCQHFDWCYFRLSLSTLTLQTEGRIGGHNLTMQFRPNDGRYSKTLYWEVLENCGWAFDWCKSQRPNTLLTPKIGDCKTFHSCYAQMVVDGSKSIVLMGVLKSWFENQYSFVCLLRFTYQLNPNSLPRCAHISCKCTKIFSGFALCLQATLAAFSPTLLVLYFSGLRRQDRRSLISQIHSSQGKRSSDELLLDFEDEWMSGRFVAR